MAFLTTAIDPSLSLQDDALPAPSLRVQILRWQIKTEGYDGLFGIRGAVSLKCKELISLCLFEEMKWQMVGFVREGNMAAAIFLQPGKNP